MPPKRKADSEEVVEARPTRAAKAARTNSDEQAPKATKPKVPRTNSKKEPLPSKEEFKKGALPLHVNIMHNPPPIDQVSAASQAPGFLTHLVLTPGIFTTRSYGWKGSKKLMVELQDSEGSEKRKVYVQLNINATVLGSKPTEGEDEGKGEEKAAPVEGQD